MAALARILVAMVALFAQASASNHTTDNATTTTTTVPTTTTALATTTTNGATTTTVVVQTQEKITGTITLSITGSCSAFVADPAVKMAIRETIASVAGSSVTTNMVSVSLTHSCSRRLSAFQKGTMNGRRLSGTVTVAYTILLPPGHSVAGSTIQNSLTSTSTADWTTTLTSKLSDAGITGFTVTVTGITAAVATVALETTTTATTTIAAGVDSSALLRKAFSSAHFWGLLMLLAANSLFG